MCCLQTKLTIQKKFRFLQILEISVVPKGTVDYDPIQGIERLVIALVSRIQKSGIGYNHRRTGNILLGGLNIICPNETCWSHMHKMILS